MKDIGKYIAYGSAVVGILTVSYIIYSRLKTDKDIRENRKISTDLDIQPIDLEEIPEADPDGAVFSFYEQGGKLYLCKKK